MNRIFDLDEEFANERLDKALAKLNGDFSRTYYEKLIKDGFVEVDGVITKKPAYRLRGFEQIEITDRELTPLHVEPENIPLDIVYQDSDLLIVNKPAGMVVHPGHGHQSGTLVNALLYHISDLSGINGVKRPGIVHRIDKDTSGLLLVCKNDFTHEKIAAQLLDHSMNRQYYALVNGTFAEDEGKIIAPIGRDPKDRLKMAVDLEEGKPATTMFKVIERFNQYSLIHCRLTTGRTHQIRVHLTFIDHPIEGDPVYGRRNRILYQNGQLLHAERLTFVHPRTGKEMTFHAPLPAYFEEVLTGLRKQKE